MNYGKGNPFLQLNICKKKSEKTIHVQVCYYELWERQSFPLAVLQICHKTIEQKIFYITVTLYLYPLIVTILSDQSCNPGKPTFGWL